MVTIGDLVKLFDAIQSPLKTSQKAFANYLRYLCAPENSWSEEVLQGALETLAHFPHWRQNSTELLADLSILLRAFERQTGLRLYSQTLEQDRESLNPVFPEVFEVRSEKNTQDLIHAHLKFRLDSHKEYKLLKEKLPQGNESLFYALILSEGQGLAVRQFSNLFTIRNGALEPLNTEFSLEFNTSLDLSEQLAHRAWIAPFTVAYFKIQSSQDSFSSLGGLAATGVICRGMGLEPVRKLKNQPLEDAPSLFFFVRRIENLFLKRETNPFYTKTVRSLERAIEDFRHSLRLEPLKNLNEILLHAKNALEYVFVGDSLLTLLIKELEIHVGQQSAYTKNSLASTTNSSSVSRDTAKAVEISKVHPGKELRLTQSTHLRSKPPKSSDPLPSPMTHSIRGQLDHLDFVEEREVRRSHAEVSSTKRVRTSSPEQTFE